MSASLKAGILKHYIEILKRFEIMQEDQSHYLIY